VTTNTPEGKGTTHRIKSPHSGGPAPPGFASVLRYFLRLGTLGFGGPIAVVGYMQRDLVQARGWISKIGGVTVLPIVWRPNSCPTTACGSGGEGARRRRPGRRAHGRSCDPGRRHRRFRRVSQAPAEGAVRAPRALGEPALPPSPSAPVLGAIYPGQRIKVTGERHGWVRVED
jgi:hypothetical protein